MEETEVQLKCDKNNGYFTWKTISRWILRRIKSFSDKSCRENENTRFILHFFSPKIVPFMR